MVSGNVTPSIVLVVIFSLTCTTGLIQQANNGFTFEEFVTKDSTIGKSINLISNTFQSVERPQSIILSTKNILQPGILQRTYQLDKSIKFIENENNDTFVDLCWKIKQYCKQRSILELWNFNETIINSLTNDTILAAINTQPLLSLATGDIIDVNTILAGITRDSNGNIISANDLFMAYFTRPNSEGFWEDKFVEKSLDKNKNDFKVYVNAEQSLYKEQSKVYGFEFYYLAAGTVCLIIYSFFQLGKLSAVEHRAWILFVCLVGIGLSLATGIGLTIAMGYSTNQMTSLSVFFVLGIGVDDMFIITHTWDNIKSKNPSAGVKEVARATMKKAGVSVLMTSLTDSIVFFAGSASQIDLIRSFTIMTALSIVFLFVYQCTFCFAFLTIDAKRRSGLYDGCCFCFKHKKLPKDKQCIKGGFINWIFGSILSKNLVKVPVRVVVIAATIVLGSIMAYYITHMKVHVDFSFYQSALSYSNKYYKKVKTIERQSGLGINVYIIGEDMYKEWNNINLLEHKLEQNEHIANNSIISWIQYYNLLSKKTTGLNSSSEATFSNAEEFYHKTSLFFHSSIGEMFADNVRYEEGKMVAMSISAHHKITEYSSEAEAAMNSISDDCNSIKWNNATSFPFANEYIAYQSGYTALMESKRNLVAVGVSITIIVLVTIMSAQITFWVSISVLLTLVNVGGMMVLLGIPLEPISSVGLVLTIGLAVDYSAHLGHNFLLQSGSRNERASKSLKAIGPAVFNGGFSSFLVLIFVVNAESYSFNVFSKIFSSVMVFGLWHGLVFLPVVLSLVGPTQHAVHKEKEKKKNDKLEIFVIENMISNRRESNNT